MIYELRASDPGDSPTEYFVVARFATRTGAVARERAEKAQANYRLRYDIAECTEPGPEVSS